MQKIGLIPIKEVEDILQNFSTKLNSIQSEFVFEVHKSQNQKKQTRDT